jgi:hypothetical protein
LRTKDLVKWHRAVNEIRYKHTELELLKEMADEYNPVFNAHVREFCEKNGIDIEQAKKRAGLSATVKKGKQNHEEEQAKLLEDGEVGTEVSEDVAEEHPVSPQKVEQHEMHDIFKKLFKKLAVHLHPDKVMGLTDEQRHDRLEMFKDAKQALDDERYFFLLDLSDRFNITLPNNYKQQTRWMKARSIELESEIASMKSSFNYSYADCDTDEAREKLVMMFLSQVYGI